MFTLECLPEDADLFFKLLRERNGTWEQYYSRKDYEDHSKIECLLKLKGKGYGQYVSEVKDYIVFFLTRTNAKTLKFIPKASLDLNCCLIFLNDLLIQISTYNEITVKNTEVNWKEQKQRHAIKLLLNITG